MTTIGWEMPEEGHLLGDTNEQSHLRDGGECSNASVSPLPLPEDVVGKIVETSAPLHRSVELVLLGLAGSGSEQIKPIPSNPLWRTSAPASLQMLQLQFLIESADITRLEGELEFLMIAGGDQGWGEKELRTDKSPAARLADQLTG